MVLANYFSRKIGKWSFGIESIKANNLVFLYSNGMGFISREIATGIVEIADHNGDVDEEYSMHLNRFQHLSTPFPPSKVSEIMKQKIVWARTMISLKYEAGLKVGNT